MTVVVLMAGANVWGRMVAHALRPLNPIVINETGTKRATQLSDWLAPDRGPPLGEHTSTRNLRADIPSCDFLVNGGCGMIFKRDLLDHPRYGLVNGHPGLLPAYRGLDPVCWSIKHGDPLGATVHFMDEGIDTGPILLRRELPATAWSDCCDLVSVRLRVMQLAADLILEFLSQPDRYPPKPQNPAEGNYYGAFPEDANLQWPRAGS